MKKQTVVMICIIALLLLVVGCFGIYGIINHQNSKDIKNAELFRCMPSDIIRYSVDNGDDSYTLVRNGDVWEVEGNEVAILDQKSVQDVINSASLVTAEGALKEKDLKSFDTTQVQTVTLTLIDGNEFKINFVGHKGESVALQINNDTEIYQTYKTIRDILITNLDKFRATRVFEQLVKTDEVLTYYSFTDYDNNEITVRTKTASEITKSKLNRYVMESPYIRDVDDEAFEQQIVVRIPLLAVARYIDDSPDNLTKYGLDEESRAVLKFKWGESNETLYLGAEAGGLVYASRKGQDGIFALTASQLEFLHTEPFYIIRTGILTSDIENIKSVIVKAADVTYEVRSSQRNSANGQFFINGADASKLAFESVLKHINGLEIVSEVSGEPEDRSEIIITIYYDNGSARQSISLTELNDLSYVAFINGKAEFNVSSSTVNALLDELNNISKNPMKTDKEG